MKQRFPQASLGRLCADVSKSRQSYYERGWQSRSEDCTAKEVVRLVHQERKQLPHLGTRKLYHMSCHMLTPEMAHEKLSLYPKSWKTKKGLHVTAGAPLPLTQNL
jgi:hypothetical protein